MTIGDVMAPTVKRVRAYFAPVDRTSRQPTIFDPAQSGGFLLGAPPSPWVDLGWISGFNRKSGTVCTPVRTGAPAIAQMQVRSEVDASVHFAFESWGKLQMALSAGTQQLNLLATAPGAAAAGSGGAAIPAFALQSASTATSLSMDSSSAASLPVGSLVAVDVDYASGATGWVGSGVTAAYVKSALADVDYVRRVTLNVSRVEGVSGGVVTLATRLPAGVPTTAMKVQRVAGLCDREGSSFFEEWSGLFVSEGQQGERVIWHYPRLQTMAGIAEESAKAAGGYQKLRLSGAFRALPVLDPLDGERVVCFRSYLAG